MCLVGGSPEVATSCAAYFLALRFFEEVCEHSFVDRAGKLVQKTRSDGMNVLWLGVIPIPEQYDKNHRNHQCDCP